MIRAFQIVGEAARELICSFAWAPLLLFAALVLADIPCAGQTQPQGTTTQTAATEATPTASLDPLTKARKHVQEYFEKFTDLTCKESVTQLVLNEGGHTIYRENSSYDYQFETSGPGDLLQFHETRESHSPAFRDASRTLLVTTGFASLLLVAHPMYEASYTFEPAGNETIGGVSYSIVTFAPVPGATSPASLRLRGRNYPLPMSGALWIEQESGAIIKLEARVDSGLSDLGLKGMRSEVHYATHTFHNPDEAVWIADSAIIDVETPRQHWRNLHRFTDYKRFNVNVQQEIGQLP